jgi:hypothetical protein
VVADPKFVEIFSARVSFGWKWDVVATLRTRRVNREERYDRRGTSSRARIQARNGQSGNAE